MGNKLREYIRSIRELIEEKQSIGDIEALRRELLTEIGFWQHERLIHLLVTILFALITMSVLIVIMFCPSIAVLVLFFALLCLLVPYIRHYYILENGVQTLYVLYEELTRLEKIEGLPEKSIPSIHGVVIKPLKKWQPQSHRL